MWKGYRAVTAFCTMLLILSTFGCSGAGRQMTASVIDDRPVSAVTPSPATRPVVLVESATVASRKGLGPGGIPSAGSVSARPADEECLDRRLREESSPVLDLVDRAGAPEGFGRYRVRKGDTPSKICGNDPARIDLFLRVNRIDARHLTPGRSVLVPIAMGLADRYVPVPMMLPEDGGRRIVVYLDEQYFGAYEHGRLVFWGPVSTGRKGHGTPVGKYRIEYRQKDKKSIKYDGAPMPYALNLSWTGYFLHEQALPGYPASHGCVRLLMDDAKRLFYWIGIGDPVDIVRETGG